MKDRLDFTADARWEEPQDLTPDAALIMPCLRRAFPAPAIDPDRRFQDLLDALARKQCAAAR